MRMANIQRSKLGLWRSSLSIPPSYWAVLLLQPSLLNCVKEPSGVIVEHMILHKLVGRFDDPCLAVLLVDLLSHRRALKVSELVLMLQKM